MSGATGRSGDERQVVLVGDRRLALTSLNKVMYPEAGFTKADVLAYYSAVAPALLPLAADRPATRKRWVHGVGTTEAPGQVFFVKNLEQGAPDWVPWREIEHKAHRIRYPLVNDLATLTWAAQMGALELHVPQWRVGPPGTAVRRNPDRLVLDLDPGEGAGLLECAEVARWARAILIGMGLDALPVTSGSKGIHLYAALTGSRSSDDIAAVAHELARALEADHPDLVVSDMKKERRRGKVLVDWSQNNAAKTTLVPYSLRGTLRPMAAAPRTWQELGSESLRQLEPQEVVERLERRGDLLAALSTGGTDSAGDALERSRSMRDPERTPEPRGEPVAGGRGAVKPAASTEPARPAVRPAAMLASPMPAGGPDPADTWALEMKWDGIRALAVVEHGALRLVSRNDLELTATYPELGVLPAHVDARTAVLDGEVVAVDEQGRPSFSRLQQRSGLTRPGDVEHARRSTAVRYLLFDVLEVDGRSLLDTPYRDRRRMLERLVRAGDGIDVPPETGEATGDALADALDRAMATSEALGLEGVIAKRVGSPYRPSRRSPDWLKLKHQRAQEVVVGGWRPGAGRRAGGVGSLLLGIPTEHGLEYVGRVGTGFSDRDLAEVERRLSALQRATSPFREVPRPDARDAHWVTPALVGEVRFAEWTHGGHLRQPSWRGWRPDKRPAEVIRES